MSEIDAVEYHIEPVAHNSTPTEKILARLNELGAEGWVLCDRWPTWHLVFRRVAMRDAKMERSAPKEDHCEELQRRRARRERKGDEVSEEKWSDMEKRVADAIEDQIWPMFILDLTDKPTARSLRRIGYLYAARAAIEVISAECSQGKTNSPKERSVPGTAPNAEQNPAKDPKSP